MWNCGKFISAVRWRIGVARGVHSTAICLGAACGVGLLLMPIVWWWGESGAGLSCAVLVVGLISGLSWGFMRRPSRLEAAVEADRQLGLDDLLGTIELLSVGTESGWRHALLTYANDRCRFLKARDIKIGRASARLWAGVGVLTALLLTFGWFGARSPSDVSAAPIALLASSVGIDQNVASSAEAEELRPPGPGGSDVSNRMFEENRADDSLNQADSGENDSSRSSMMSASVGSGSAVTQMHEQAQKLTMRAGSGEADHGGDVAKGAGESDVHAGAMGANRSTISAAGGKLAVAPWESKSWGADANQAIRADWVPAEDTDLVREYFSRAQ
jgi:hypothetical protein